VVRLECCAAVILILSAACNSPEVQLRKIVHPPPPGGPQVEATVITIHTTQQPENKTTTSTIVIGSDFARAAEEVGMWRLFDFRGQRVAFVDDIDKTYRYESLKALQKRHADAAEQPMIDGIPRAEFVATDITRPILGIPATRALVKLGAYERELWFGEHPQIPSELFSLMQASELPGPAAPMVRKSTEALLNVRGFPLVDHSEVPFGKTRIVVDRTVVSIGKRKVPEALLVIPETYRDISVKEPAARPPDVASPPPDQKTPAEGSQSSSTTQTNP
jgi:hypothetical protein